MTASQPVDGWQFRHSHPLSRTSRNWHHVAMHLGKSTHFGSLKKNGITAIPLLPCTMGQMPNFAARKNLEEAIDAERAQAVRRLRRYEEIAQKHNASQQPGGAPLSVADLLEWHSFAQSPPAADT